MNLEAIILEVENLECYISNYKERGWIGALENISIEYNNLICSVPYSWYFSRNLDYDGIPSSVKGNEMEFDALLIKLANLKSRLESYSKYSTVHIGIKFMQLKEHIISHIKKSDRTIDIAVAWLSDKDICSELSSARKRSVQIRVLTIDCETNKGALSALEKVIDVRYAKSSGNFMHNKFSVFDSSLVISGSYNWSHNARNNDENIMIVMNQEISVEFEKQFNILWQKYK